MNDGEEVEEASDGRGEGGGAATRAVDEASKITNREKEDS